MSGDLPPAVTDADIRSLAAKLKGLHALLTPGEQALLRATLRRAAEREEMTAPDTEGFAWAVSFNPFTFLDAIEVDVAMEQMPRGNRAAPNDRG
jgi:hypothetical protein